MYIKTVETVEGVNKIKFDDFTKYYWVRNIGETDVHASAHCTCAVGGENTVIVRAGEVARLENYDDDCAYIVGAGKVEVYALNIAECPFKIAAVGNGSGGGVNMTCTTLYNGSVSGVAVTLTDTPDNYDIVYIINNGIQFEWDYYGNNVPVFMFPKIGIKIGNGGAAFSEDGNTYFNSQITFSYSGVTLRAYIKYNTSNYSMKSGTITVYGIKLGG